MELQPYDAGTDSGAIYTSPDEVTVPFQPISHLTTGPFAGDHCFEICRELGVESVLVSEDELFDAFRWTYARTKLACELGGAAPVAALLAGKAGVRKGDTVVAVVSGGNIAPQQAAAILAQA